MPKAGGQCDGYAKPERKEEIVDILDVDVSDVCQKVEGKTIRLCVFSDTYDGLIWTIFFTDGSYLEVSDIDGVKYRDGDGTVRGGL